MMLASATYCNVPMGWLTHIVPDWYWDFTTKKKGELSYVHVLGMMMMMIVMTTMIIASKSVSSILGCFRCMILHCIFGVLDDPSPWCGLCTHGRHVFCILYSNVSSSISIFKTSCAYISTPMFLATWLVSPLTHITHPMSPSTPSGWCVPHVLQMAMRCPTAKCQIQDRERWSPRTVFGETNPSNQWLIPHIWHIWYLLWKICWRFLVNIFWWIFPTKCLIYHDIPPLKSWFALFWSPFLGVFKTLWFGNDQTYGFTAERSDFTNISKSWLQTWVFYTVQK
jgi:hypothetical protein